MTIADEVAFAAALRSVSRIGTCLRPPKTARTEQLSTTALDQSIWPPRESQFNRAKWIRSQTPACCQSRKRLQHVIPDPQPISCGNISHGMPLRRTNKMPLRQARSDNRGLRPFGLGGSCGKRGSISSHKVSGISVAAMSSTPLLRWKMSRSLDRSQKRERGFVRGSKEEAEFARYNGVGLPDALRRRSRRLCEETSSTDRGHDRQFRTCSVYQQRRPIGCRDDRCSPGCKKCVFEVMTRGSASILLMEETERSKPESQERSNFGCRTDLRFRGRKGVEGAESAPKGPV